MIGKESYYEHTIPVIAQYFCDNNTLIGQENELLFMQDNAPGHAAKSTKELIALLGLIRINWPPYSPDLNLIETFWKYMKNYLQKTYGNNKFKLYEDQRKKIQEA